MRFGSILAVLTIVGLVATSFVGAEEAAKEKKVDLAKILKETKCPMSGKAVDPEKVVAYKDSKVFMCCGNCVKGFGAKVKKDAVLAAKANHQLVVTHQAKQAKCCVNGKGKINKDAKTKVAGVQVNTCCKNCLGKLTKMDEKEQIQLVFGKNFEKSFVVKAQKEKEEKAKKKAA
jgi:hypothetical protein